MSAAQGQRQRVLGLCYDQSFKKYILWSLKLMQDQPDIFQSVKFATNEKQVKDIDTFDIVITDQENIDKLKLNQNCIIAYIKNVVSESTEQLTEVELLAISGQLSNVNKTMFPVGKFNRIFNLPQQPTTNLLFYYVHSLMIVTKILLALVNKPIKGQIEIRNYAVDNLVYLQSFFNEIKKVGLDNNERGQNMLDGGAPFYNVYQTKDKRFISVGCIEAKFYKIFVEKLPLKDEIKEYLLKNQLNADEWPKMKEILAKTLISQPTKYWIKQYEGTDACVTLVNNVAEVIQNPSFKDMIHRPHSKDEIWKQLQKDLPLKKNIEIYPHAKL